MTRQPDPGNVREAFVLLLERMEAFVALLGRGSGASSTALSAASAEVQEAFEAVTSCERPAAGDAAELGELVQQARRLNAVALALAHGEQDGVRAELERLGEARRRLASFRTERVDSGSTAGSSCDLAG